MAKPTPKTHKCQCLAIWNEQDEFCLGSFISRNYNHIYCQACRRVAERCSSMAKYHKENPGVRVLGSTADCDCGCGLSFVVNSAGQKYAPECAKRVYRRKQTRYRYESKRAEEWKKPQPVAKPKHKQKRKTCSVDNCNQPIAEGNRMLCDWHYKKGSDLSEQAHCLTNRPIAVARRG